MGLDMYLRKYPKVDGVKLWELYPGELAEKNPTLKKQLEAYEIVHEIPMMNYSYKTYYTEVGYWRKANQIHNWFVENVQGGEDECNPFVVSKEQVQNLLDVCRKVDAKHTDGVALELLPPVGGFFFGGTDIDEWYWKDIENTIAILEKVLLETDWDSEVIVYQSSW